MKAGGRRELIIPPDLGYGPQGSPPSIPANATLIFVVDMLSIN
jgi:FKBP-type peptidyl-prolyl cis-trans isomerase